MAKRLCLVGTMLSIYLLVVGCGVPQEEHDAVVAERDTALAQVVSLQKQLSQAQSDLDVAQSELARMQNDLEAAETNLAAMQSLASSLQMQISSLQSDLAAVEAQIAELEVALAGPKYGGSLTVLHVHCALEPASWDPTDCNWIVEPFTSPYMEKLVMGDFEGRGPLGSNEFPFTDMEFVPPEFMKGCLAESWVLHDPITIIYNIRKQVYWPDRQGVMSSREVIAQDVAFCMTRLITSPRCPGYYENIESITALNKYAVQVKLKKYEANWMLPLAWGYFHGIYPPEVIDAGITDWRNAIGTGPFVLADYTRGDSLTWDRNPLYWDTTIIGGKEYPLPFVDRLIWPIIPDTSTQLAALRTGKCDIDESVSWHDEKSITETNPELVKYRWLSTTGSVIATRVDTQPFNEIRVRRALNIVVDRQAMIDSLYDGNAEILSFPFSKDWPEDLYTPIEELSEAAQELFVYDVYKARQLMAEAGYPNGFKAEIVCTSGWVDVVSLLADYWSELGVELDIQVVEYGVYYAIMRDKAYKHMYVMPKGCSNPFSILQDIGLPGQYWNSSMFNNNHYTNTLAQAEAEDDPIEAKKLLKYLNAYIIEQAPYVILPTIYNYSYAWPWVKNWHGELNTGSRSSGQIYARIWIDTDMKKAIGY